MVADTILRCFNNLICVCISLIPWRLMVYSTTCLEVQCTCFFFPYDRLSNCLPDWWIIAIQYQNGRDKIVCKKFFQIREAILDTYRFRSRRQDFSSSSRIMVPHGSNSVEFSRAFVLVSDVRILRVWASRLKILRVRKSRGVGNIVNTSKTSKLSMQRFARCMVWLRFCFRTNLS